MSALPKTCARCEKPLGRRNKTGMCQKHYARDATLSPETRAKISATRKLRYKTDPEFLQRERARMHGVRALRRRPGSNLIEGKLWDVGNASQPVGSPSRMRAGAKRRFTCAVKAGCPLHMVEQYYFLTRQKGLTRAEAISAVQQQEEADLQRFRRRVGAA